MMSSNYLFAAMKQMCDDIKALDEAVEAYNNFNIGCINNKERGEKTMLKPKTILALFEDGSDEAMKFALPYAADILRKIIKENEDVAEAQYIKDEQEGKAMENDMTNLETDGLFFQCTSCGQCFLLPYQTCPSCNKKVDNIIPTNTAIIKSPIKTEELCENCQRTIDCAFLPCRDCEMGDMEYEAGSGEHYICKCTCVAEGEPCPFYIARID